MATDRGRGGAPYALCAMALVAGGLMPVLAAKAEGGLDYTLPVLTAFATEEPVSLSLRLMACAPVAAWLVVSIVLMTARGLARTLILHALAVTAWFTLFTLPDAQWMLASGLETATKGINGLWPLAGGLGLLAATLAYAGNRARMLAPENRIAAAAGALAPVYLVFALVYPLDWPRIGFMGPIHLFMQEDGVWPHQMMGFFRLLAMLVLGASALIAIGNTGQTPAAAAKARLAFGVWWLHLALIVLGVALIPVFLHFDDGLPWNAVVAAALNLVRSGLLTLGWLFLLLCTSAELLSAGAVFVPSDRSDRSV